MTRLLSRRGNPIIHREYAGRMNNVVAALNREVQLATPEKTR